ncbi:hypothetical protein F4777DRAFT_510044 [Nemania sp. FL0916]|nr:hypothetical protein F4777DRAFT_510044 [Nemania sp. FL0916]
MDQVDGDLGGYVQEEVGDRSTPDNPPSIDRHSTADGWNGDRPMRRAHHAHAMSHLGKLTGDLVDTRQERRGRLGKKTRWNPALYVWGKTAEHQMSEWSRPGPGGRSHRSMLNLDKPNCRGREKGRERESREGRERQQDERTSTQVAGWTTRYHPGPDTSPSPNHVSLQPYDSLHKAYIITQRAYTTAVCTNLHNFVHQAQTIRDSRACPRRLSPNSGLSMLRTLC